MLSLLEELNPEQRIAAETTEGPLLILAGAGTGKTRAITFRMANLIASGVSSEAILAVTFTNKAAQEMRTRVSDLLLRAGVPPSSPWLSTFHSLCARLLRREAVHAGLPKDFVIYDDDDQLAAVKLVMATLKIDDDALTPRNVLSRISHAKNHGKTAEMIRAEAIDKNGRHVADIFTSYEKQLKQAGALDFDDLLLRTVKLLRDSPAVREKWQARFQYILVDEYQDTNRVQYELLRLLTGPKHNLCVVGDEDQSIYRWRGADVSILLSFSRDFPDAKVIKLERNYRSTQQILNAAGAVVANNPERLGKTLSAVNGAGANLRYFEARDAQAEAEFVAGELQRILDDDSSQTCAVEYRTNFQSRAFEEAFRRRGVRYKLVGGFSFYNRAEVKDALAYVRLAMHPDDDVSLLRVLNVPPRGIGKTTLDALRETARADDSSLWTAIGKFVSGAAGRTSGYAAARFSGNDWQAASGVDGKGACGFSAHGPGRNGLHGYVEGSQHARRCGAAGKPGRADARGSGEHGRGRGVFGFSGCRCAGERCGLFRRQTGRDADHAAQHQGIGIRSRFSDRAGRRHLPAQPLVE